MVVVWSVSLTTAIPCAPSPPALRQLAKPVKRKVFDVVTFMDETDLLALRVLTLHDFVDVFVVGVCNVTFSNKSVDILRLGAVGVIKQIFDQDRIVTIICGADYPSETTDPWKREEYLRDHVMLNALKLTNNSDDLFIFTDVDEMPAPHTLKFLLRHEIDSVIGLNMPLYKYHYGCVLSVDSCAGTVSTHALAAQRGGNELRYMCGQATHRFRCAGWHCSNCMAIELIQHNFFSFSHYNDSNFPDTMKENGFINTSISTCSHGKAKYTCTEDTHDLPPLIWTSDFASFRPRPCLR